MIRAFNGKIPRIAPSAFVSEWAYVIGDVEIGENSGVWPGAVIRGDFGSIRIGRDSQIEDNSVLHSGTSMDIGDQVIIGHGAVIHGKKIGNNVLIGNNATVLDLAEIGDNCIVAANSMIATERKIPSNSVVTGVPGKVQRELSVEDMEKTFRKINERYERMTEDSDIRSYKDMVKKYKQEGL